jgi:hypothetical protein
MARDRPQIRLKNGAWMTSRRSIVKRKRRKRKP